MSCEGDSYNDAVSDHPTNSDPPLTWLQIKKAQKASVSAPPSIRASLAEEFDKYCTEPNVSEDINPFEWWAENKIRFPHVAAVSREYLAVPATSVASERIFSKCGLVCSDRRAALNPQHVEQLVFLSQNLDK